MTDGKINIHDWACRVPDSWVQDAIYKAADITKKHKKIVLSISGGSDSDIMLHIFQMLRQLYPNIEVTYIWFNTGLEYQATKRHLKALEEHYGIKIIELKAKKPIPLTCRKDGQPFLSKRVACMIGRLQRHNFQWEDEPFEVLIKRYPKCRSALRWWCNAFGEDSKFNISRNKWLKEFMVENPPRFNISDKCCQYAKKGVAEDYIRDGCFDLSCTGVRKAEGGARADAFKNCYSPQKSNDVAQYRPLFWFTKKSKELYKHAFEITYSDCYEVWGLDRTGCACCPFGKYFEYELECVKKFEPQLYGAVLKIFGNSYEYTRKYREYQRRKEEDKNAED